MSIKTKRNIKSLSILVFLVLLAESLYGTPDRYRIIHENLLGFNEKHNSCIILQTIYDNLQSHDTQIIEQYIVEKKLGFQTNEIISKVKVTDGKTYLNYLNGMEYKIAIPDLSSVNQPEYKIIDSKYLEAFGRRIDLQYYLAPELKKYKVLRVIDQYFDNNQIYFTIDMVNASNTEYLRKVIAMPESHYSV